MDVSFGHGESDVDAAQVRHRETRRFELNAPLGTDFYSLCLLGRKKKWKEIHFFIFLFYFKIDTKEGRLANAWWGVAKLLDIAWYCPIMFLGCLYGTCPIVVSHRRKCSVHFSWAAPMYYRLLNVHLRRHAGDGGARFLSLQSPVLRVRKRSLLYLRNGFHGNPNSCPLPFDGAETRTAHWIYISKGERHSEIISLKF